MDCPVKMRRRAWNLHLGLPGMGLAALHPHCQRRLIPLLKPDEVVVKKRALKWVKQQVFTPLHGKDLPEGAQAREVTKVPYQIQVVPREGTYCPVGQQSFKTHHCLMVHLAG